MSCHACFLCVCSSPLHQGPCPHLWLVPILLLISLRGFIHTHLATNRNWGMTVCVGVNLPLFLELCSLTRILWSWFPGLCIFITTSWLMWGFLITCLTLLETWRSSPCPVTSCAPSPRTCPPVFPASIWRSSIILKGLSSNNYHTGPPFCLRLHLNIMWMSYICFFHPWVC